MANVWEIAMPDLNIKKLTPRNSKQLSHLLNNDEVAYSQFFKPFATDYKNVLAMLEGAVQDRYWGLWFNSILVGFFMLRGFDEGYHRPAYGVYISNKYSNRGLSKLALEFSTSWCRLNGINSIILKVHPDNIFAKKIYEKAGFILLEICPQTGHNIMEKAWDAGI